MEIWKSVVHWPEYEVSSLGNVRRTKTQHVLKPDRSYPYKRAELWSHGKKRRVLVHCMVMEAFVRPKNAGDEVNHINGDRWDARLENLEYTDRIGNVLHARDVLGEYRGERNSQVILNLYQVRVIKHLLNANLAIHEIATAFRLPRYFIKNIKYGNTWAYVQV